MQACEISDLKGKCEKETSARLTARDLFSANELLDSFQKVIKERDSQVSTLTMQLKKTQLDKTTNSALTMPVSAPTGKTIEQEAYKFNDALSRFEVENSVPARPEAQTRQEGLYGLDQRDEWLLSRSPQQ